MKKNATKRLDIITKRVFESSEDAYLVFRKMLKSNHLPEVLIGHNGLFKQLTKVIAVRALNAEMNDHLGHGKKQCHQRGRIHTLPTQ